MIAKRNRANRASDARGPEEGTDVILVSVVQQGRLKRPNKHEKVAVFEVEEEEHRRGPLQPLSDLYSRGRWRRRRAPQIHLQGGAAARLVPEICNGIFWRMTVKLHRL